MNTMTSNDELERQKRQDGRRAYDKAVMTNGNDVLNQWLSTARWLEENRHSGSKQEQSDG